MTSSMLIMECDENGDGKINKEENEFVYNNYFMALSDSNFYTDITINKKVQSFPSIKNFKTYIEKNKLVYSFDIEKEFDIKNTKFDFGDSDFYVAMVLKKEFITIKGASSKVNELDNDFYFGYQLEFLNGVQ